MPELSPSNITFLIGILGTLFGVYHYFKNPQTALEKTQAVNEERDKGKSTILAQKETEAKATLLAQQVQWEKEANEKKFIELGERINNAFTLAQNHIHTIDTKVDTMVSSVNSLNIKIAQLTTIVEERLPKK